MKNTIPEQLDNPFGNNWYKLTSPVQGVIAAIDYDGCNNEIYRIGLSAMQITNLGIERESVPFSLEKILEIEKRMKKGLLDGQDFGNLGIRYNGKSLQAQVYNAFGKRSIDGPGIAISSILAEGLGLRIGDKVRLYTEDSISQKSLEKDFDDYISYLQHLDSL